MVGSSNQWRHSIAPYGEFSLMSLSNGALAWVSLSATPFLPSGVGQTKLLLAGRLHRALSETSCPVRGVRACRASIAHSARGFTRVFPFS